MRAIWWQVSVVKLSMCAHGDVRLFAFARQELDGGEAADTEAGAEVLVAGVVSVEDGDVALFVIFKSLGHLGPSRLEVFAMLLKERERDGGQRRVEGFAKGTSLLHTRLLRKSEFKLERQNVYVRRYSRAKKAVKVPTSGSAICRASTHQLPSSGNISKL